MKFKKSLYLVIFSITLLLFSDPDLSGQPVPGKDENIPFLVTFGKDGKTSWGDDHFYQVFFFMVPKDYKKQLYIRIFDPDCGGENDEIQGEFDTKTLFSVFGGKGVDPDKNEESRGLNKGDNFKRGNLLASRIFGKEAKYDNKYYTFGPFNPTDGDFSTRWNSYVFKVVCEGISGDDGNLYRYFMSSDPNNNIAIEGANAFTYEYTFRMWNDFKSVSHIYPFIDTGIISIKIRNFDWDNDGEILVVSRYKQGKPIPVSNEDNWVEAILPVEQAEQNSSMDIQFHKKQGELVKNNNVVLITLTNRNEALPYFASPIGGVPVYIVKTKYIPIPKK